MREQMSIYIGEKIRHLRIYKKLSQSELVEGICSVAYLSRIENGKAKPSKQFLDKISKRLDVSIEIMDHNSSTSLQDKIVTVLNKVEEESKSLSNEEEALLRMSLLEFLQPSLLIRVFSVLLNHSMTKGEMNDADTIYRSNINLIDVKDNTEFKDLNEQQIYFRLHNILGKYFYSKQNFSQAHYHYSISENLNVDNTTIESAKLYYNISLVKQRIMEDKSVALYYCKKSYDLFLKLGDTENIVNVLVTLGVQYHLLSQYDKSLRTLQETERYLADLNVKNKNRLLTMITYNIGKVFQKLEKYDEAIVYYNKSLANLESDVSKVYVLKGLLEIKLLKKEWTEVKDLLDTCLHLVNQHQMSYLDIELHVIKAIVFKQRGDFLNYEKLLKRTIERAEKDSHSILIKKMAEELAHYYFDLKFYKKSSEYYLMALNHSSSV